MNSLLPRTWPEVNCVANHFGSIIRGVVAATHTPWVMVGVRQCGMSVFGPSIVSKVVQMSMTWKKMV